MFRIVLLFSWLVDAVAHRLAIAGSQKRKYRIIHMIHPSNHFKVEAAVGSFVYPKKMAPHKKTTRTPGDHLTESGLRTLINSERATPDMEKNALNVDS